MTKVNHPEVLDLLRNFNPDTLVAAVIETGEDWADKDSAASSLEETKKSFLARLTLEYSARGVASSKPGEPVKPISIAQAEARALADPRYEQHLELMVSAREHANRARVRYDLGRMKLELMRSWLATARNEIRMSSHNT